jgi:hypothetical protein
LLPSPAQQIPRKSLVTKHPLFPKS